ncbi:MAG TPA: hypothetical protein VGL77_04090 [Armatimonadota bacterium]|jgi:hypothetical protein
MKSRLCLLLLLVVACSGGWAYPTLYGDTGLVEVPTADTLQNQNFDFAVDYTQAGTSDAGVRTTLLPIRLDYAVVPNAEVFAFYAHPTTKGAFRALGGGAKIRLIEESKIGYKPSIAVGGRVIDVSQGIEANITNVYAVASVPVFRFGSPYEPQYRIRLHAGVEYLRYSKNLDGSFTRPFAGVSFEAANNTAAVVEFQPKLEKDGIVFRPSTVSGALRFPLTPGLYMEFGATRPYGFGDSQVSAGLLYHFDPRASLVRDSDVLGY